jgi:hypothetical protein
MCRARAPDQGGARTSNCSKAWLRCMARALHSAHSISLPNHSTTDNKTTTVMPAPWQPRCSYPHTPSTLMLPTLPTQYIVLLSECACVPHAALRASSMPRARPFAVLHSMAFGSFTHSSSLCKLWSLVSQKHLRVTPRGSSGVASANC